MALIESKTYSKKKKENQQKQIRNGTHAPTIFQIGFDLFTFECVLPVIFVVIRRYWFAFAF